MATVDKNFRIKNGLVVANNVEVQGTSLTVNGNQVLTTADSVSAVTLGTSYPSSAETGTLFLNTVTGRMAIFDVNAWREIAYLTELESIYGGEADTTLFGVAYDGGDASTVTYVGVIEGGDADDYYDTGGFTL